MKQAANEDLDKEVYTWFIQKHCQGFPVSGIVIRMCFPGMRVSHTHIPKDACFPPPHTQITKTITGYKSCIA